MGNEPTVRLKTSSLKIQPHHVSSREFGGGDYWRVEIDGRKFAEHMSPIRASAARFEQAACTECGVDGCGTGEYAARRFGDYVCWFADEVLDPEYPRAVGNMPEVFFFDARDYESAIGRGKVEDLPPLRLDEAKELVKRYLPGPQLALYTDPPLPCDPRGEELLLTVAEAFNSNLAFQMDSDVPTRAEKWSIGLELPGLPQCEWWIGESANGLCVLFAAYPKLPCWLSGPLISRALDIPV